MRIVSVWINVIGFTSRRPSGPARPCLISFARRPYRSISLINDLV
jgi:hypothetical protein